MKATFDTEFNLGDSVMVTTNHPDDEYYGRLGEVTKIKAYLEKEQWDIWYEISYGKCTECATDHDELARERSVCKPEDWREYEDDKF